MFIHSLSIPSRAKHVLSCSRYNTIIQSSRVGISLISTSEIITQQHNLNAMILQFIIGTCIYGMDWRKNNETKILYDGLYTLSVILLSNDMKTIPYILILFILQYYKDYKKYLGVAKPAFVSIMWTLACVILPYTINNNNLILNHIILQSLSCYSLIYALSNYRDINDADDDLKNGILTIPVMYKKEFSILISKIIGIISIIIMIVEKMI